MPRSNVPMFAGLLVGVFAVSVAANDTVLISATPDGNAGNGSCEAFRISGDGRFVTFTSLASDLVPVTGDPNGVSDLNGVADIFLRDRDFDENGVFDEVDCGKVECVATEIISVNSNEEQASVESSSSSITPNGRYVAFTIGQGDLNWARVAFSCVTATPMVTATSRQGRASPCSLAQRPTGHQGVGFIPQTM